MSDKTVSTGPLTGALKPKYRRMHMVLGESYQPMKGLDIYLDFNTFVTSISKYQRLLNAIPFEDEKTIYLDFLTSIISTFKHMRFFSRKWDDVRIIGFVNDFEIVATAEKQVMKSYLVPFVNKFKQDRFRQLTYYWDEAWKTATVIMKYLPGMYLLKTKQFDSYVLPEVLDDYKTNGRDRLIISANPLFTNYQFSDRTFIMYSRFNKEGMTQLSDPFMIAQSMTKIDDDIMMQFVRNRVCFNLLNAIVGDFERGIIGLPQASITSIAYTLLRCIEHHEIPDDPKSVESVLPAIDKSYHDYIKQAYPLVDVESHANLVSKSMVEKVKAEMVDAYDIDGLNAINIDGINLLELL